ncbi:SDR family NAD(P)-dependent oxidoreductase [Lacticaseibacillus camelliae]|uniref:SDR family NAD(P)-dependent oxidoreductase n=1 Tax=Lacticaseibacillus camelliae TaxID=381742 RepID=UPI000AE0B9FB|nr:SDR family NAD(P)-dependent oxidoreductase [Lacticaseibacillus camelliae]
MATDELTGKVVLVTGAAMGNGLGIARVVAQHGAKVALADISPKLPDTVAALKLDGFDVFGVKMDVADTASVTAAVKAVIDRLRHHRR